MLKNIKGALSSLKERAASKTGSSAARPAQLQSTRWPADATAIAMASRALHVNEFELFRVAYRRWHGEDIADAALERAFGAYLKSAAVPSWVRQMTRDVIDAAREDRLDPREFGVAHAVAESDPEIQRAMNDIFWLGSIAVFYAVVRFFPG